MATITGAGLGPAAVQAVFAQPFLLTLNSTGTVITASNTLGTVTINGSGFGYTSFVQNGTTFYQLTSGTITSLTYYNTAGSNQQWSGLNVSAVDASNDLLNSSAFDNLFFSGDDTIDWEAIPSTGSVLFGVGGNDTFNVANWDDGGTTPYVIDGGSGNNTLNISGGIGSNIQGYSDFATGNSNFNVTNIQTVDLAAGTNYKIFASASLVTSGNTLTIDASALGPSNSLIFNTNIGSNQFVTGNLVLLGGAGDDVLEGGKGNTVYNGGSGNNTVDFMWNQQLSTRAGDPGVTADLSNTGTQNFGTGYGTGSFINIQNLIGTRGNDTLTGDATDNNFIGEGGNDTINGGAGFDTAVFANPYSSYTITHSGITTTVAGPEGTTTLNSVEVGEFSDRTVQISGPVVTTTDFRIHAAQSTPLSGLFSVTDLNGLPITTYQLWDSSTDPNSGYFTINGVPQPAHTVITVSAAQMAQTAFVGGIDSTSLQIRAADGTSWSASDNANWAPFIAGPGVDNAPVVTTSNVTTSRFQTLPLSSLFTVDDADGDTMTEYQLWNSTSAPGSGYFTINGVAQPANTVITISAAQLADTNFVSGMVSNSLQIRAFDGYEWSAADNANWAPFTVSVPADNPPAVGTSNLTEVAGQTLSFSSLVSVSDADGDTITQYQLWDSTPGPNAGYWEINGVPQPAGSVITISATQAAQTNFVTSSVATGLQVRAFDGALWSAANNANWAPFTVSPPTPSVSTQNLSETGGQTLALSSLFSVSDTGNLSMTKYELWDSTRDPGAGYFTINGVAQPAGTVIDITAAQLAQTSFVTGTVATNLQIRANDGYSWSAADNASWAPFTVSPPVNHPPLVGTSNTTLKEGATVPFSSLFSVFDIDGDTMTQYQLWDSTRDPNAGYITVNGVAQPAGTVISITAAQLAQTDFVVGSDVASLQIRAYDGQAWSAADNASWAPFTVTPTPNHPPVVTTVDYTLPAGYTQPLWSLFQVSDADGDNMTQYQLWESGGNPNAGYWSVNGVTQPAGTVITLTPTQMEETSFVAGLAQSSLQIRAFDGTAWSAADNATWAPFTVSPPPPVVTTSDVSASVNQSLALSSLFTVSDTDGNAMTEYQLWDSTGNPNSGHFVVNGVAQPSNTTIDITASQLSQTSFLTGTVGDSLQIRAFDGFAWSAADNANWAPFHVNIT